MPNEPEKPELPSDDEIEARFNKIRENLHPELDDVDAKLDGILQNTRAEGVDSEEHDEYLKKLDDIDAKITKTKTLKETAKPNSSSLSGSLDQKSSLSMGLGLTLAYTIVGTPLLGYGAGILINNATHTQGWHIWLTLIGAVIGIGWVVMITNRHGDRL